MNYAVLAALLLLAAAAAGETLVKTSEPIITVSDSVSFSLSDPPPYGLYSTGSFPFVSLYFDPGVGTLNSVTAQFEVAIPVFVNGASQSVFLAGDSASMTIGGSAAAEIRLEGAALDSALVSFMRSCTVVGDGDGVSDFCTIGDGSAIDSTPAGTLTIDHTQVFSGAELAPFLINDAISRMFIDVEVEGTAAGDLTSATLWARTFGVAGARVFLTLTYDYTPGGADADADGIADSADNCTAVWNPDQLDVNGDSIGNICDADVTGPGGVADCIVNFLDLSAFRHAFFSTPASPNWNPEADLDGSGSVNFIDVALLRAQIFGPPGPSASGCDNSASTVRATPIVGG